MASLECRSLSAVFMPNSTTNHKTFDMPQDPTLWNQSRAPGLNASKLLKQYRQLHHRIWHMLQIHHIKTLNSSPRPSTMRSMTQSRYPRRGLPEAPLSLHIKATNWLPHACNGNLVMAITEVIAGHTIPTENHLILPKKSFGLNTKTLENCGKRMDPLPFLASADAPERKERGPRRDGSGGGALP